jgi:hypothetical protein
MQARAIAVGRYGQPIAFVIRPGFCAKLAPRDATVDPSGNG